MELDRKIENFRSTILKLYRDFEELQTLLQAHCQQYAQHDGDSTAANDNGNGQTQALVTSLPLIGTVEDDNKANLIDCSPPVEELREDSETIANVTKSSLILLEIDSGNESEIINNKPNFMHTENVNKPSPVVINNLPTFEEVQIVNKSIPLIINNSPPFKEIENVNKPTPAVINNLPTFEKLQKDKSSPVMLIENGHKSQDSDNISVAASVLSEALGELPVFNHAKLVPGAPMDVQLSFAFSTRHFYVTIDYNEFIEMTKEMTKYYNTIKKHHRAAPGLKKTQLYVIKDADVYFRVQVVSCSDQENVKVLLVDSGEEKVIQIEEIIELDPKFSEDKYPIMSMNCCLSWDDWALDNIVAEAYFLGLFSEEEARFQVKFYERDSLNRYSVTMKVACEITGHKFVRFNELPIDERCVTPLNLAHYNKVHFHFKVFRREYETRLSFAKSLPAFEKLSKLYPTNRSLKPRPYLAEHTHCAGVDNIVLSIHQKKSEHLGTAEDLTTNISWYYRNSLRPDLEVDIESIVAFHMGNYFFRGFVLSKRTESRSPNSYHVLSVDFGFVTSVQKEKMFPISPQFDLKAIRNFAFYASISNTLPLTTTMWLDDIKKILTQTLAASMNKIQIVEVGCDDCKVVFDVNTPDGNSLSGRLIELNMCIDQSAPAGKHMMLKN